jgi:hypothetical protein
LVNVTINGANVAQAKDKTEFDQFMAERRARTEPSSSPPQT